MTRTELEIFSVTFVGLALGTVIRSLALACLCGVGAWLMRSRTAGLRFLLWQWALLALFALPILSNVTPRLTKPSRALSRVEVTVFPSAPTLVSTEHRSVATKPSSKQDESNSFVWILAIPALYFMVTLVLLGRLGYNLGQLRRIAERSQFIPDPNFRQLSQEIWLKSGAFVKPRVVCSDDVSSPVTFDADDVWIVLPMSWSRWDEAKLRAVLSHEMAHVQRGDPQNLLLASLGTCLFWFHPLSWFLQRQLSVLAEEACDEIVVTSETAPEQYANFLIDFARDVRRSHSRLVTGAIAVAGRSPLKRRIERLFADTSDRQHGKRVLAATAFALFIPALYVSAAARPNEPQERASSQQSKMPRWPQAALLSPDDAPKIESALQADPKDLDSRMELLMYYGIHSQEKPFTTQLLWFIKDDPSADSLMFAQLMFGHGQPLSDDSQVQIAAAWEEALTEHPSSPAVLYNATGFLENTDPDRSLALLREADALDPSHHEKYYQAIVMNYANAEYQAFHPGEHINNIRMISETVAKLRDELANSSDPELLAETGRLLVRMSHAQPGDAQFQRGLDLIQQAVQLDPGNTKWTEALAWAQMEPQRKMNYEKLMKREPLQPGTVRIGSKVAEANLISKTDPVYPALARQARIQGTVEFTVTVGADGKVQELTLVRGHPMLAQAAMEAVTKYVYKPVLLEGKAVPIVTDVIVPFHLEDSTNP